MLVGLIGLIGGIALAQNSLWFVLLSIVGFLLMFAGGMMSFRADRFNGRQGSSSRPSAYRSPSNRQSGGLGDRMEDSFRRRFER